jgi:hypothetical protein
MDATLDFLGDHWPWFTVMAVLWLIGHFMEDSVFTKERGLENHPVRHGKPRDKKAPNYREAAKEWKDTRSFSQKLHHWVFWWGRESMELHGPFAGALIGLVWLNPEGADPAWDWQWSAGYFLSAGFMSMFGWLLIVKVMGRLGVDVSNITLPGETRPPDKPDADK